MKALNEFNAIDAEDFTRKQCLSVNGKHCTDWCRNYFRSTFPRLTKVIAGRILLGEIKPDKGCYYYVPNPF